MKYQPGEEFLRLSLDPGDNPNLFVTGCDPAHAIIELENPYELEGLPEIVVEQGSEINKVSIPAIGLVDADCYSEYRAETSELETTDIYIRKYVSSSTNSLTIIGFGTIKVIQYFTPLGTPVYEHTRPRTRSPYCKYQ
jgi:hypothetical protein